MKMVYLVQNFYTKAANWQQSEKENFELFARQHCIISNDLGVLRFLFMGCTYIFLKGDYSRHSEDEILSERAKLLLIG